MKSIFNKYNYNITVKTTNKIKHLDGAKSITMVVKTYESGEPVYETYEIYIDWAGVPTIERVV